MMAARKQRLRGELYRDHQLASYTTWRVGGLAKEFYRPVDIDDLSYYLSQLPEEMPLLWLGLGSNLLVRDGGFPGAVIFLQGRINDMSLLANHQVDVAAGAACAHIARFAARNGLVGAAFLAGIPGTMGGALAMNAGAFGGETWQKVIRVTTIDKAGNVRHRSAEDYKVAYRQVNGPIDEWFVSSVLQLEIGEQEVEQSQIRNLLSKRNETQPIGQASAGSTFKNPEGDFAARLIESVGLKGYKIGEAQVSEKHANFIINTGGATAADIEQLIEFMQEKVKQETGVNLVREVRIIGERL